MNKEKLTGTKKLATLIGLFPQIQAELLRLGINEKILQNKIYDDLTLVELALQEKMSLNVLLNSLSEVTGLEIEWPKIKGMELAEGKNTLRLGKPEGIKSIWAISSANGGAGKSWITRQLARALAEKNRKVGILDLNFACPAIGDFMNIEEKLSIKQNKIIPIEKEGIKVVSVANMEASKDSISIWKGANITKAIEQLFHDVNWKELDVLIVDLPAGLWELNMTFWHLYKPDLQLIITNPERHSWEGAQRMLEYCQKNLGLLVKIIGNKMNPAEKCNWNEKWKKDNIWLEGIKDCLEHEHLKNLDEFRQIIEKLQPKNALQLKRLL